MFAAPLSILPFAALPAMMFVAALTDLREYRIPNWTSGWLAIGGLAAIALSGMAWTDAGLQLAMGAAALALGVLLFALGVWGGGDGKLVAAAALWFDPSSMLMFLLYTSFAGAGMAVIALALNYFKVLLWRIPILRRLPIEHWAKRSPYGVAIAIGALAAFPESLLFRLAFG